MTQPQQHPTIPDAEVARWGHRQLILPDEGPAHFEDCPGCAALSRILAENERLREALREIAAQPTEREVDDLHLGRCLYPVPNTDAVGIARQALSPTEEPRNE